MQALFAEIDNYRQTIEGVRDELTDNYFSIKDLVRSAQKSQMEIEKMIQTLEQARQQKQLRKNVIATKLSAHPQRKPILASIKTKYDDGVKQAADLEDEAIQQLVSQNCSLELVFKPIRLHPTYATNVNCRTGHHLIPQCRLKLWLYHIDKKTDSTYFTFSPHHNRNIHKTLQTNIKLETLHLMHRISSSNVMLMKELLQEKVYLFLENQFKLIIAMCAMSVGDLIHHNNSHRMLKFTMVGSEMEMFTLQGSICLRKLIDSPELQDLLQKMHVKRVVVKQNNRSRSPSPTLHRQTANSVLKSTRTKRVTIMNNRPIVIPIGEQIDQDQEMDRKISIQSTTNITTPSLVLRVEKGQMVVKMLVKLQNDEEDGYLQCKVGDFLLKVTVKDIKLLTFLTLEKSKIIFKTDEDCQKVNALVALTDNVYIRPSMILRIQQNPIEQKVVTNSIVNYFCKTQHNPDQFLIYPLQIIEVNKVDKGVNVLYSLRSEWLQDRKEVKIVIAAKSKARLIKTAKVQEQMKQSKNGIAYKQNQQYYEYYIELYVIRHQILSLPEPEVSLSLEVDELGIYGLDMAGILMKNSRYLVESMNDNVLHVINQEFKVEENLFREDQQMQVQVLQPIDIKKEVIILLHDLTRSVMTTIRLQLNQKQYWKKHG